MTITLTHEEAQQVLDALVFATPSGYGSTEVYRDSIVLLQNRLAKETPYEVGQRLHRQGLGISDIPTDVYSDGDIAEAYRGFEDARLAQPEPEPVAVCILKTLVGIDKNGIEAWKEEPLYTAPPQRDEASAKAAEWVGLTDEERTYLAWESNNGQHCVAMTEAKLKEKNT